MSLQAFSMSELLAGFGTKRLSPVDSAEAMREQIDTEEPRLNTFVLRETRDTVLAQARAAEARWLGGEPKGFLDGIPITVKDSLLTKGWPTRFGSLSTSEAPAEEDAPAVARAREAGAIIGGKTTTPEFSWKAVTDSPLTGISRNPWNQQVTPGGSSGGAAAAVAAGQAVASIGTDAGGSVRIPASFCGVVAIKATRGRVPAYPPSFVWTMGHVAPIARTVQDLALLLDVMSQPDVRDWNAQPPLGESYAAAPSTVEAVKGLRVDYCPIFGKAKIDPEVAELVLRATVRFAELGAHVEQVEAPLPDAHEDFTVYYTTCIGRSLQHLPADATAKRDPGLAKVIEASRAISRERFIAAYEFQIRISREARLFHQRSAADADHGRAAVYCRPFLAGRLRSGRLAELVALHLSVQHVRPAGDVRELRLHQKRSASRSSAHRSDLWRGAASARRPRLRDQHATGNTETACVALMSR
jgi:aspartyl-tRNA(Asn)/glutamyl-tRNA(Gln) amidotransferase subunit A